MKEGELSYQIIRSARRTIAIQIGPDGKVLVRCPNGLCTAQIHKFVESKASWIHKQLLRQREVSQAPLFTQQQLRDLVQKAQGVITQRVAYFAPQVGVRYGRITIRTQRTRWGSCSSKGNLNFNGLLMLAPPEVLDYVVVHELCHRKEMNHSARFWAAVERVLPDYRKDRKWLRENGSALIGRLSK